VFAQNVIHVLRQIFPHCSLKNFAIRKYSWRILALNGTKSAPKSANQFYVKRFSDFSGFAARTPHHSCD
jgi:hypothetical protein